MKFKTGVVVLLSLLLCICTMSTMFAHGGGGSNNPFSLKTSNPKDGQKKVSIDSDIILNFSKNVVNIIIKDNNEKCFKMLDEDGQAIPIEIIMADDQIDREKRNDIILAPKEPLGHGKTYTVIVAKDLMSKSGVTLENEVTISFTTISENSGVSPAIWILATILVIILIGAFFITKRSSR